MKEITSTSLSNQYFVGLRHFRHDFTYELESTLTKADDHQNVTAGPIRKVGMKTYLISDLFQEEVITGRGLTVLHLQRLVLFNLPTATQSKHRQNIHQGVRYTLLCQLQPISIQLSTYLLHFFKLLLHEKTGEDYPVVLPRWEQRKYLRFVSRYMYVYKKIITKIKMIVYLMNVQQTVLKNLFTIVCKTG